jgi:hypothetical protein
MDRAVLALLEHASVQKAAAAVNISDVTLWRWMQQEEFQRRLRTARRQAYAQSIGRLQQSSAVAVNTLLRVMTDSSAPAASRVRAARAVLKHAAWAIEIEDLNWRVTDLERAAEKSTDPDQ